MRTKARLKFLLADWGTEKFRQVLEDEYLGYKLPDGPAARSPPRPATTSACTSRRTAASTSAPPRSSAASRARPRAKLADLVEAHGSTRLRTTPHQKLVILDVPEDRVEPLIAELDDLGLPARPSLIRRGTIACTGIEYCKLAIVETKARDRRRARPRAPLGSTAFDLPHPISLHVNGCPNSCARIQTADIGLKGQMLPTPDGEPRSGLPGPPRRRAGSAGPRRGRPRPHRPRPEGHAPTASPTTSSAWSPLPRRARRGRRGDVRPVGAPRRRGGAAMSANSPPRAAASHRRAKRAPTSCAPSPRRATPSSAASPTTRPPPPRSSRGSRQLRDGCRGVACSMADAALPHLVARAAARRRRAVPRHRLPLHRDLRDARRGRRALDVRIVDVLPEQTVAEQDAEFGAQLFARDPPCAARAARSPAAARPRRLRGLVHRASAATRPPPAPTPRWSRGTSATGWSRSTRSRRGPSTTCSTTPANTRCPSTSSCRNGYPSIGCEPCTEAGRRRRGPPRRPLGRPRQDGMRATRMSDDHPDTQGWTRLARPRSPPAARLDADAH